MFRLRRRRPEEMTPAERNRRRERDWLRNQRRAEHGRPPLRRTRVRTAKVVLGVVLAFFVLKADSCVVTRYNVFGVPVETEHTAFDHIDDPCGAPSAWDKARALVDPNYNHCFETYWWKITRYEFVDGQWVYRAQWWNGRECGAMTHTWRDAPSQGCTAVTTGVRA